MTFYNSFQIEFNKNSYVGEKTKCKIMHTHSVMKLGYRRPNLSDSQLLCVEFFRCDSHHIETDSRIKKISVNFSVVI